MIVIAGAIRSGSSLLAEILHNIGVPLGERMMFPLIGGYLEWEDSDFTKIVMNAAFTDKVVPVKVFKQIIKERQEHYQEIKKITNPDILQDEWGLKCPPLLLFSKNLERAAKECGEEVKWIYTYRPKEEAQEMFFSYVDVYIHFDFREKMMEIFDKVQDKIYIALEKIEDEKFVKNDFENDIPGTIKKLTEKLNLKQVLSEE